MNSGCRAHAFLHGSPLRGAGWPSGQIERSWPHTFQETIHFIKENDLSALFEGTSPGRGGKAAAF